MCGYITYIETGLSQKIAVFLIDMSVPQSVKLKQITN